MKHYLILKIWGILLLSTTVTPAIAWEGMAMPELHVEGNQLRDPHGNIVKLHGFAQTFSPWFNERGQYWSNYNVQGCLNYNKRRIDELMAAGWKMNFVRMHMDPYWSNTPGVATTGENDISAFNFNRFKIYLTQVFIPMAEYAISKGLYVVMRPPGVCPEQIAVGDAYQQYLLKVWKHVAGNSTLKNHPNIMFELANEPITILGSHATYGNSGKEHFEQLHQYFQTIVDTIRAQGCRNILWVPGLAYQAKYAGYADFPIEGDNIGYAVHIYPGWFGSGNGYDAFVKGWNEDVQPVADFAPIMITEMDWADEKYNASWGKAHTGVVGDGNFGANFKHITDAAGNVSWLLFTSPEYLAAFKDEAPTDGNYTFLTDPEACPWPIYHWYQEYAEDYYPRPDFTRLAGSDAGNGQYNNPVIFGDFPDPDVIRVDDNYYMISTTMHIFPGATILQSKDLVNWEYCTNPLEYIEADDAYNLENGKNRYGHGQWATSLKYHDGKYHILFTTLDEGGYLLTSTDIRGPWKMQKLRSGYYDGGLLFDGDNIYVAYGINNIHVARLDENFNTLEDKVIATYSVKEGLEGSRFYKIGDYYYIYATYGGYPAYQTVFRSTSPFGPYEEKFLLDDNNVHQGALVETQTGEWWTMLFADRGAFGRLPYLLPVTWENEWPVIGDNGKVVETCRKPDVGATHPARYLATNDNFRHYELAPQWGWNHNCDRSKWSLTENAGSLRLYTATVTNDFYQAKNTLTQRIMGYHADKTGSFGTVCLDVSAMQDGDIAGLAVFQDPTAYIGIKKDGDRKKLVYATTSLSDGGSDTETVGQTIDADTLYLRAVASYMTGKAHFYYSTDNKTYTRFGEEFSMKYNLSVFTGNKFAIFNYATKALGGRVDVDWFSTEPSFSEETYFDNHFEGYSQASLTLDRLDFGDKEKRTLLTGTSAAIGLQAIYQDGHSENISTAATYSDYDPEIIAVANGRITALKDGQTRLTATYKGGLGDEKSTQITIEASTFPLVAGLFNPSIWETGSFDEKTHTVVTGKYGFAGWRYSAGIDISDYKYLVAQLGSNNNCGISFRIFDENNYWTGCATYDFGNSRQVVAKIGEMFRNGTTTRLDPGHIYIVGFWSYGNTPFIVKKVYLTNSDTYEEPGSDIPCIFEEEETSVDVYTLSGLKIRTGATRKEALSGLPAGIYIIGNEKITLFK